MDIVEVVLLMSLAVVVYHYSKLPVIQDNEGKKMHG
jgi:hypothetical protein